MKKHKPIITKSEFKCNTKLKYASERIANIRAAQLTKQRGVPLFSYKCPLCKKWHHTSDAQRMSEFEVLK